MALLSLLCFNKFLNILVLHIYGDSKIIIDHVLGKISINNHFLIGWMKKIEIFWQAQNGFSIQHVDRSQNEQADRLSKKGLSQEPGKWYMDILLENITYNMEEFLLPGT